MNTSQNISTFSMAKIVVTILVGALLLSLAVSNLSGDILGRTGGLPALPKNFAAFPSLKDLFKRESTKPSSATTLQTIKIVSEESQVIDVIKKSSGAVVSIIASADVPKIVQCRRQIDPFFGIPQEFQGFFDVPVLCQEGTERRRVGAGTGFLVSADGYIITNRHVVENEKGDYTVMLNDSKHFGQSLKAKVLARSPNNDIAILKIDIKDLLFLSFSDSSKLQVGQTSIAIGYALGEFDNTVSKGVVSGLLRSINARNGNANAQLRGLIQTDAAINPGNSGGPLLDIAGNVIGMNTAIANAQSIGFAIPSNDIRVAYEQARTTGKITASEQTFLGIRYLQITQELQESRKLPYSEGVLIAQGEGTNEAAIVKDSPADKAGLKEGDIILEVDGKRLNERVLLYEIIGAHKPGDIVELKIWRAGTTHSIRVTLEKRSS